MKKIMLTAMIASLTASAAFATTVPVTRVQDDTTTVNVEYAFDQRLPESGHSHNGFGVGLSHGVSDRAAIQYSYGKVDEYKDHRAGLTYALSPNVNVYGEGTYIKARGHEVGGQVGLVGHTQLTDKVQGYAKAGFGNDIKQSYQIGAKYALTDNVDLNAYYGYDKYSVDDRDSTVKGLHAGVGYSF